MQAKYGWYIAVAFLVISLISGSGLRQLIKIRWDIRKNNIDVEDLIRENMALKAKINEIKNNPRMMEVNARSKLGMVKANEIVYEIK